MESQLSYFGEFTKDFFGNTVARDCLDTLCGKPISFGVSRIVFEHAIDKSCVVKFETSAGDFQNVFEWDLWQQHSKGHSSTANWLAPCVSISPNGIVLVQKRAKPVPFEFKLPKMIPNILDDDQKRENWGIYKGRLVCRDYGRHNAIHHASKAGRVGNMVKANWIGAGNGHFKPVFGDRDAPSSVF